jgi:hypothetical protein
VGELSSYDYALIRVVPRAEREEFINSGVILFCAEQQFLGVRLHMDERRLRALWVEIDMDLVRRHLDAFPKICSGDASGGTIAGLSQSERFQWLVSPRSTIIQISPVHTGLCESAEATLEQLFRGSVVPLCATGDIGNTSIRGHR